jgi:predicted XRE-type DNA-binding protein
MTITICDLERDPKIIAGRAFAQTFAAFLECSDDVQALIRDLIVSLKDPETSEEDRRLAISTIAEALFPPSNGPDGRYGIDLAAAEGEATGEERAVLDAMDAQEAHFGARVEALMKQQGLTQGQLAEAIGVKQPAVSLLLSRRSRPQRRTVERIAKALNVSSTELWPDPGPGH